MIFSEFWVSLSIEFKLNTIGKKLSLWLFFDKLNFFVYIDILIKKNDEFLVKKIDYEYYCLGKLPFSICNKLNIIIFIIIIIYKLIFFI